MRWGQGGFRVLLPPLGSVHAPREVRPNFKVGNKKRITQEKKIHIRHPSPLHAHTAPKPRSPARPSSHPSSLYSYRAKHWSHGSSAAGRGKARRSRRTRLSALGLPASAFSPPSPPAPGHEPGRAPVSSTGVQPPRPPSLGGCGETPGSNRDPRCWQLAGR